MDLMNEWIDERNFFCLTYQKKHKKIWINRKIVTGQGDDYKNGYLLDYPYFKENYEFTKIDLSKQQASDICQKHFTENIG